MIGVNRRIALTLWLIIGISMVIHVVGLIAGQTVLKEWRWPHHAVHAAVEMSGSIIALYVAITLLYLERYHKGTDYNVRIAGALIGMGVLDGFHAMAYVGETFVWLHSTATFVGGTLFALIVFPDRMKLFHSLKWPLGIFVVVSSFGVGSLLLPEFIPSMIHKGEFTWIAKMLNILGGIFLFIAALHLVRMYRMNKKVDNLLFVLHCSLFGAAAILFEQSALWNAPWWSWHALRLMAYVVALWFIIGAYDKLLGELDTHQQHLEKLVSNRTSELKAVIQELETFSYSVSHDLRAPLRRINGFCEVFLENYYEKIDDEGKRLLNIIRGNTRKMGQLIDDLLDFSRMGRQELNFSRIDMENLARVVFEELKSTASERTFNLKMNSLPSAYCDPILIRQVFVNLLSNAIKFTQHEDSPVIEIGALTKGGEIVYYIQDNGAGFDMRYIDKLFGVFQRIHTEDEFEGTGVGLAIVQRIIHRHNGRVWAEGKVGEGATFYFSLPAKGD